MSDHDPRADDRSTEVEEQELRRLLEQAGPRPEVPPEDLEAITAAARAAWRETVARDARGPSPRPDPDRFWNRSSGRLRSPSPSRRPSRFVRWALPLAAGLVVALGVVWWWSARPSGAPAPEVARFGVTSGDVRVDGDEAAAGSSLAAGTVIRTGGRGAENPGRAALRLEGGAGVRLDTGTRLRLASAEVLELERGAIYVETERGEPAAVPIAVRTPLGTARDIGTRFALRLIESPARDGRALRVRVRDGAVSVERRGTTHVAAAGYELTLHRDGEVQRRELLPYGPDWSWVLAAAPRFEVEGKSLQELLDWVSRETGWSYRFEDEALAASAEGITLHGSLGDLRPDQAPFAVLPGAGLEGELENGTLTVRRGS